MKQLKNNTIKTRKRRHNKIRTRVSGTSAIPRLSVSRSNKFIYAQLVDDNTGTTLAFASDRDTKDTKATKTARAHTIGKTLAELAKGKSVTKVVFDRGGFMYTGRVRALAEGAREGGLIF